MLYVVHDVLQSCRLALACCLHCRLGEDAKLIDFDVVIAIGHLLVAQSLLTRDEVARELASDARGAWNSEHDKQTGNSIAPTQLCDPERPHE